LLPFCFGGRNECEEFEHFILYHLHCLRQNSAILMFGWRLLLQARGETGNLNAGASDSDLDFFAGHSTDTFGNT
jgi:hypothetical protein